MAQRMSHVSIWSKLKALQLVLAAKMHFPDQASGVAVFGKMLWPGDVFGKNDPVIAPAGTSMRFFSREHAHATGCTGWIGTAGSSEMDPVSTQLIEVLSLYNRVARETCDRRCVLIGHD